MSTSLRKSVIATVVVVSLVLVFLLGLGIRQHRGTVRHQQIVNQTEKVIFQFVIAREHLIESVLARDYEQFQAISREMEGLHQNLSVILANADIPDQFKLSFLNQIDLSGIILLLRELQGNELREEKIRKLNREVRVIGERLMAFDRILVNHARKSLLSLQSVIIGALAITVFILTVILLFFYRRLAVPLISLAGQAGLIKQGEAPDISGSEGCKEIEAVIGALTGLASRTRGREEMFRASQMAVIGELTSDVAHEINNLSNGIINYAQILADEGGGKGIGLEQEQVLGKIIKEGERIATISCKLLSCSEGQEQANLMQDFSLGELVNETLSFISHRMRSDGVRLVSNLQDGFPAFHGNRQNVRHIFLNILNNSIHSLNERYPGKDDNKLLEVRNNLIHEAGQEWLRTTVTDRGVGIKVGDLDKVFEPDFTTKAPGTGSGLGLAISREIVNGYGGRIRIDSVQGDYTTVTVDLPVS